MDTNKLNGGIPKMGEWKKHKFVKKDVAIGFAKGASQFAALTYPRVKKVGKLYVVKVKH